MTKNKKGKKNRGLTIFIIIIVVIIAFVALGGLRGGNRTEVSAYTAVEVTRQDMQTTVRGSGVVESQDKVDIYAPSNISIEEVFVENGDEIVEGTPIAKIDQDMYLDAEKAIIDSIDQVDDSISSMYSSTGDTYIYSSVKGTVKTVNIETDELVEAVINKEGALFVISADNNMKLNLNVDDTSIYQEGDVVTVKFDEEEIEAAIVEISKSDSNLKVVFEDDEYAVGQQVEAFDADGNKIGDADMEINVPIYVQGDAGTASYVYVKENSSVSRGSKLLKLKDNYASGDLIALTEQREDLQNQLDDFYLGLEDIGLGSDYTIYSTSEGIVDNFMLSENMTVAEGTKMYTTQSTHPLMMYVPIDELDISQVTETQQVELKFEALPGETYDGEVTKINSLGESINGVTNYTITVVIEDTDDILIGMSGNIKILTEEKKDVLTIPVEAVQLIDDEYYVILGADANIKTVADHKIETGINDGAFIEVVEGLTDGDTVAVLADEGLDIQFGPGNR